MKCKFDHEGDCCNCGSPQYMAKCKPSVCNSAVPMTNADRIRAMSDEELAEFLGDLYVKAWNDGHDGTEGEPYYHDWVAEPPEEERHG